MISKKKLVELLGTRGIYKEEDDILIDEMYHHFKVMRDAKADIRARGNLTACDKEGRIMQQNPSIAIYNSAFKNIITLAKKFGLSPRDRAELKLEEENDDGFDD